MKSSLLPIILLFLLVIVVAYIAAKLNPDLMRQKLISTNILHNQSDLSPTSTTTFTPSSTPTPASTVINTTFQGAYFQFNYPRVWQIKKITNQANSIELVSLGIKETINDTIGVFKTTGATIKPGTGFSNFSVGGNKGWKWTESGNNYYSYYYLMPNLHDNQYLELIVTLPQQNNQIENQLNQLIDSLRFKIN